MFAAVDYCCKALNLNFFGGPCYVCETPGMHAYRLLEKIHKLREEKEIKAFPLIGTCLREDDQIEN